MKYLILALAAVAPAACTDSTLRYDVPAPAPMERQAVNVRSVEVREVSLPLYAGLEAITVADETGALVSNPDVLWADDPVRTFTQGLASALDQQTTATVAAEPWPLSEDPDLRLDVRVASALAGADGQYRLAGQYFAAAPFGDGAPDRSGRFDISVPFAPGDTGSIARAQGQAIEELARTVARQSF